MQSQRNTGDDENESGKQGRISWPSRIALKTRDKLKAYREKTKSAEYRKERRERWTIIGLFAAAGFALLQWNELRKTDEAIKRQVEIMEADQRPWLAIDGDHHSGLKWEERGGRMSAFFNLKNVGKTPAANVFFEAKAVLPKIGATAIPLQAMMEYSADIDRRRASSIVAGEIYFPDHTYPTGIDILIDRNEFKALMKESNVPDILPRIIACASYSAVSRTDFRHTCTSYYVTTFRDDKMGSFGVSLDIDVPANHIGIGTAFYSFAN